MSSMYQLPLIHLISRMPSRALGHVTRDGGMGVGTRAHFRRKKYLNIYYTDTFWTNFIYCMPTFKNKNSLAVFCHHSESDVYHSWQVYY